ncbi:MAG: DUF262 domain-containing protein [Alphaproteobacteria bacterium]|nr:DUF262 domain-containing protein [Alphaproteobacteria bacterium]
MATTLHSFIDIFGFSENPDSVKVQKICIPIIQRDYAQGREDTNVTRVRKGFLKALHEAVTKKPIVLDFVYGDIDKYGNMIPLDGQQRLTTLFLLHWYAAKKAGVPQEESVFLKKFSYATRYSARYFCADLCDFTPTFNGVLSEEIKNQTWFPFDWEKDPTIRSMLVMLDAIDEQFKDVSGLWEALKNGAIKFYFLPIKDMGLTDELYIKMNSRGKPLTMFEHIKAELEKQIKEIDDDVAKRIMRKIDKEWTDLLWRYRSNENGNIIDDAFLRYFNFICDIIGFMDGENQQSKVKDEFDLLTTYFKKDTKNVLQNIDKFEQFFGCWCNIPGYDSPASFLSSFMSNEHETGKICTSYNVDIFNDCLQSYTTQQFKLGQVVLLYAIITYLMNINTITRSDFERRIRIINNLIKNSEYQVADRSGDDRMMHVLLQTQAIMTTGQIDDSVENNFNIHQLKEEKEKIEFVNNHPDQAEKLYELEDHKMLYGQIAILGLENLDYADRFISLFNCDFDKINCAMMTIGDYGQIEQNKHRYQYGTPSNVEPWHALFHQSANERFEDTKEILIQLLSKHEVFTNDVLQTMIDEYIAECEQKSEYPFRYYYVKYPCFRLGLDGQENESFGKLWGEALDTKKVKVTSGLLDSKYDRSVMATKTRLSPSSYMPFLKAADAEHISREDLGQKLVYKDEYIEFTNNAYIHKKRIKEVNDDTQDELVDTIQIQQNTNGIDTEDRIIKLKKYLAEKMGI